MTKLEGDLALDPLWQDLDWYVMPCSLSTCCSVLPCSDLQNGLGGIALAFSALPRGHLLPGAWRIVVVIAE